MVSGSPSSAAGFAIIDDEADGDHPGPTSPVPSARRAEQIGYDLTLIAELNLNDIKGVEAPSLDAWSTAAALAAVTEKLELMVAVRPTFHNPALLAKQAANIDRISIANGAVASPSTSSLPGGATKSTKYGIHFDEHDQRYARTSEWIDVLDGCWRDSTSPTRARSTPVARQHLSQSQTGRPPQLYSGAPHRPTLTDVGPQTPHPLRRRRIVKPPRTSSPPSATPTSCTATRPRSSAPRSPTCAQRRERARPATHDLRRRRLRHRPRLRRRSHPRGRTASPTSSSPLAATKTTSSGSPAPTSSRRSPSRTTQSPIAACAPASSEPPNTIQRAIGRVCRM